MVEILKLAQPMDGEPLRARLLDRVDLICKQALEAESDRYAALEKSTWTEKRRQSLAFLESRVPEDAPSLLYEVAALLRFKLGREPVEAEVMAGLEQLAAGIAARAEAIERLQAYWVSWRSATRDFIAALPVEQLSSYQIQPPVIEQEG